MKIYENLRKSMKNYMKHYENLLNSIKMYINLIKFMKKP